MPAPKPKTEANPDAPTEAQLATIRELAEAKGVEAPTPSTGDEAVEIIAALTDEAEEPTEPPEPNPDDEAEAEAEEERQTAEEQQARAGAALSEKAASALMDAAMTGLRDALKVVCEVDEIEPAQTPGIVGFVLPGFSEHKTNELYQRCPTCNGWGRVLTGSIREGEQEADCPDPRCKGRGFWQKAQAPVPQPVAPAAPVTGPTVFDPQPAANGSPEWETPSWLGDPSLGQATP